VEKNFFKNLNMNNYFLSFAKEMLPPFILKILLSLKKKIKKAKFISSPQNQKLNLYYDEQMAQILDNWGSRNAWIEVQHIFDDKKGKILDIACGTGKVIEILSKNKHLDIYGCDISSFLIDIILFVLVLDGILNNLLLTIL
jgi:SAM-dependent methyltransferase